MRATWRVLAGHRDFRLVLAAGLVSLSGDWILRIGLLYRVYAMTGSTVAAALAMAASFVPQLLLGPVVGVFADRWDRRRTMITADLLLAAGLLPLLAVSGSGQVWLVFVVLLWEGAVQQFFSPAEQALVSRLVRDDELLAANALSRPLGIVPVLAAQGAGYALAGLGMASEPLVAPADHHHQQIDELSSLLREDVFVPRSPVEQAISLKSVRCMATVWPPGFP